MEGGAAAATDPRVLGAGGGRGWRRGGSDARETEGNGDVSWQMTTQS